MDLVKITPKNETTKEIVNKHGEIMEILIDKPDSFMVRSQKQTFEYTDKIKGKWFGWFNKNDIDWEKIKDE